MRLHDLHSSSVWFGLADERIMRRIGHVPWMGEKRNSCRMLVGSTEGKGTFGRSRNRWEDNIRVSFRFL